MSDAIRFSNSDFELFLPLGWTRAQRDSKTGTISFTSEDAQSSVTASSFDFDPSLSQSEQIDLFKKLFAVRLKAERELLERDDPLHEGEFTGNISYFFSTFAGYERARTRRFNGLLVAQNAKIITLYVESLDRPAEAHNQLADAIFESLEVK